MLQYSPVMKEHSFPKSERLKSKSKITRVLEKGNEIYIFPMRMLYLEVDHDARSSIVQAGFSVPRKKFKRAVDRNLLKRRMREAYRLNKSIIRKAADEKGKNLCLFFIFSSPESINYPEINTALVKQLGMLAKRL